MCRHIEGDEEGRLLASLPMFSVMPFTVKSYYGRTKLVFRTLLNSLTWYVLNTLQMGLLTYWAVRQLVGRDFSENIPGVASFAVAVGSLADWLGHEASSESKHTKANLPDRPV